jgi:hypothetical protein
VASHIEQHEVNRSGVECGGYIRAISLEPKGVAEVLQGFVGGSRRDGGDI